MTEATIRGVAGMKSVLGMPVMQVRIGLIIKSFNKFIFARFAFSVALTFHKIKCVRKKNTSRAKRDSIRKSLRFTEDEYEE